MRCYFDNRLAGTQQALTTTFKTLSAVWAVTATLSRGRACGLNVGADAAPNATDCQIVYDVSRQTADGTATSVTPLPLNPADVASRMAAKANYTAEGTITATSSVWRRALNQRASLQWVAQDESAMLTWPATNLAGIALRALSPTYAAAALGGVEYEDL